MNTPGAQLHAHRIAADLQLRNAAVKAALTLLSQDATVPFIARYRKEVTGGLDEAQLREIEARYAQLTALDQRRQSIEKELEAQGALTEALRKQLNEAQTKAELEDLYRPYKPKRRTRATVARERGLQPLADQMWQQHAGHPKRAARAFVDASRGIDSVEAALAGASDICAERLADDPALRARLRQAYAEHGQIRVGKTKDYRERKTKFDTYADFSGRIRGLPSHRLLALERGEREGVLKVKLELDLERHHRFAASRIPVGPSPWRPMLTSMVDDALKRLLSPSVQTECRSSLKHEADNEAVRVFARNLRELLMSAPFGGRPVLGIDPGQRTGCKCAAVSDTGQYLASDTLFLVQGPSTAAQARATLLRLLQQHHIEAVAVGNGTHGRETARFVEEVIAEHRGKLPAKPICVSVSESGASIYSASEGARQEFPDLDLTVRGAISIARRLQDPLSELVKLSPETIGVGQYQHDVDQTLLAAKLEEVVISCVNLVGVQLNTASARLLSFVSGIGPRTAERIVAHRDRIGRFDTRQQLLEVKGLGPKTFEQCAGFLRIRGGSQPLDQSAVHPERYSLVKGMAAQLGLPLSTLVGNPDAVARIDFERYRGEDVGELTLQDIAHELQKPGRDPRASFQAPRFRDDLSRIEDLKPDMQLEGVVTNVTAFGAFVDVGVHQDGLVHISQLADRFIKDPSEVARVGQRLQVRVLAVDLERKRISLSAKKSP